MGYGIPRAYVDNFADGVEAISKANKAMLERALSTIDLSQPSAEDVVLGVMQTVCRGSSSQAAYLAKQFYLGLRDLMVGSEDGYEGVTDTGRAPGATETVTRGIMAAADYDDIVARLQARVGYETKLASHRTLYACGDADPKRPRFARVPRRTRSYADGCPFCQTLASRGFVYHTGQTAGVHVHDGCSCAIVPSWDKSPQVEGYDRHDYDAGYQKFLDHDYSQPDRTVPHRSLEWQRGHPAGTN